MNIDEKYMKLALELARKAEGLTSPNPAVGAVVVKDEMVVGKGYHARCGLPHAEVNALKEAGSRAKGATLYVTMEPCDHFGKTPPCTDVIIKSGIKNVVIAMRDPNPITNGKGLKRLKANGIRITTGVLESEAKSLNRPFEKFITTGMPYVTLKMAQSLDGKIAASSGDSKWISSDDSRRMAHELRGRVDAVMVGVNTVLRDDPLLLSKNSSVKEPRRVIVDSILKSPLKSKIFLDIKRFPVYIAATKRVSRGRSAIYARRGINLIFTRDKNGRVDLRALLRDLGRRGMMHILVEGGGELAAGLIERKLVDEFLFFVSPKIIGGRGAITSVEGRGVNRVKDAMKLKNVTTQMIADDILIRGYA